MTAANIAPNEDKIGVYNASAGTIDEALIFDIVKAVLAQGSNITLTENAGAGTITVAGTAAPPASATETSEGIVELATAAEGLTGTDTTRVPPVAVVKSMIDAIVNAVVDAAPGTLDTLNELAAALGDDPNFATTITAALAGKANNTITVSPGAGMTGGGDLSASRTISSSLGDGTRNVLTAL